MLVFTKIEIAANFCRDCENQISSKATHQFISWNMWIHIQIHALLYVLSSCALYNKYIIVFTILYLWKLVNISY